MIQRTMKLKAGFFGKDKIDKTLVGITKKKKNRRTQINSIRYEREDIVTD